jgi:hypothetical protein
MAPVPSAVGTTIINPLWEDWWVCWCRWWCGWWRRGQHQWRPCMTLSCKNPCHWSWYGLRILHVLIAERRAKVVIGTGLCQMLNPIQRAPTPQQ